MNIRLDRHTKMARHLIERREAGERWAIVVELTADATVGEIRYLLAQTLRKPGVLRVGAGDIEGEDRHIDDLPEPGADQRINGYDHEERE